MSAGPSDGRRSYYFGGVVGELVVVELLRSVELSVVRLTVGAVVVRRAQSVELVELVEDGGSAPVVLELVAGVIEVELLDVVPLVLGIVEEVELVDDGSVDDVE